LKIRRFKIWPQGFQPQDPPWGFLVPVAASKKRDAPKKKPRVAGPSFWLASPAMNLMHSAGVAVTLFDMGGFVEQCPAHGRHSHGDIQGWLRGGSGVAQGWPGVALGTVGHPKPSNTAINSASVMRSQGCPVYSPESSGPLADPRHSITQARR
jgi:hypothetical protein